MPLPLVKLVAVLLLVLQGVVSVAPGQILCIPVLDCAGYEHGLPLHGEHCGSHGCDHADGHTSCHGHDHGPFIDESHNDEDCGCHVHLPVPDSEQLPCSTRGDGPEFRVVVIPEVSGFELPRARQPLIVVARSFKPPDLCASDQVRALKTTRLLI